VCKLRTERGKFGISEEKTNPNNEKVIASTEESGKEPRDFGGLVSIEF